MIESVEDLRPELRGEPFLEFKRLADRRIHCAEALITERISRHAAIASIRRRNQDGIAQRVAAEIGQRSLREACCRTPVQSLGTCRASRVSIPTIVRNSRDPCYRASNWRRDVSEIVHGEEVLWVARTALRVEEVPLSTFAAKGARDKGRAGSIEVRRYVADPPRRSSENSRCGIDRPAFENLTKPFLAGNGIGSCQSKAVPGVKVGARVELAVKVAVAVNRKYQPPTCPLV